MPAFISFLPSFHRRRRRRRHRRRRHEGGRFKQDLNRSPLLAEAQLIPITLR
jgi:hypothetical protein